MTPVRLCLLLLLLILAVSGSFVHLRGRVRHRLGRQVFDHSTFTAPMNVFLLAFSRVPSTPYLDPGLFPYLRTLSQNWQESATKVCG